MLAIEAKGTMGMIYETAPFKSQMIDQMNRWHHPDLSCSNYLLIITIVR
jgi:hypothetical protein